MNILLRFLKDSLRNPITIWIKFFIKKSILEYHYRKNKLRIGYMSYAQSSTFGEYNTIYDNVVLNQVDLGSFTYIAQDSIISRTSIGKFCSIGPRVMCGLGKHPSRTFVSTHPLFFSNQLQAQISFSDDSYFDEFKPIEIGNDVWVGANVIILDGVKIGNGAIIGAGSIVTKDVDPYAIVAGVPAQTVRYRFSDEQIDWLMDLKWWDFDVEWLKKHFKKLHNIEELRKITKSDL